jgi:hypothetical protein
MVIKHPGLTVEKAKRMGYRYPKILATGECAGIMPMIYTTGIFVGLDKFEYRTRFCYETWAEAEKSLAAWDGHGDPPGNWIKEKGAVGGDRMNPMYKRSKHEPV